MFGKREKIPEISPGMRIYREKLFSVATLYDEKRNDAMI